MAGRTGLKMISSEPSQFASEFSELYCKILSSLYDVKSRDFLEEVKKELKNIRRWHLIVECMVEKETLIDIEFKKPAVRCAYMYSYSVLNTSIVYREFSKHMKDKESTFSHYFSSKTLKVCCLGGGPGTEAVGVIKAIHDSIWNFKSENVTPVVDVYVTVVDVCPEWKYEFREIVKTLDNNSTFFPSMKVNFKTAFFQADLLKPFEETLKAIIKESDVVTVANFVNTVLETRPLDCIPKLESVMKNVIECMSEECCLFMLDSAGGRAFYRTANVICKYQSAFRRQMLKHEGYRLHPKTLKKLESAMNFRNFAENSTLFPTMMRKVSSCIWIKTTS